MNITEGEKYKDFQRWLISMMLVEEYLDSIYKDLNIYFVNAIKSDYKAIEEEIVKRTMSSFKEQKRQLKELQKLKESERKEVAITTGNLSKLLKTVRELNKHLSVTSNDSTIAAKKLLVEYMNANINI